jgi:beta-ureidopropionase / N-carbamoyl-L-amino-acid hydrolase
MMNRRRFTATLAGAASGILLPRVLPALCRVAPPGIDGGRLNRRLAELFAYGRRVDGGVDRVAFTDADLAARRWIQPLLREAGLTVRMDVAGNLFGRREGSDPRARPIVIGSHIDSVPAGGRYDGTVGVLAAIEVADALRVSQTALRHPLEVAIWMNEEGGIVGSRIVSDEFPVAELDARAQAGMTMREGIVRLGGAPDRLPEARWQAGRIAAYLELHIEQGASLDRDGIEIGVVEGIAGLYRWEVTVTGQQNHAGATAMIDRKDALVAAARYVDAVDRVVRAEGQAVGTVGRMTVQPGAPNVIPGRVEASLELRSLDASKITRVYDAVVRETSRIGESTGTTFAFRATQARGPSLCVPAIRQVVREQAVSLGRSVRDTPSGAGHDAQSMAKIGPMGMIFVPSVGGISHSPWELTRPEQITKGAEVLLRSVLAVDRTPPG